MVTRRDVLKVGLSGVLGLIIGGAATWALGEEERRRLRERVQELEAQVEELRAAFGRRPALKGEVKIYNWSEYIADGVLKLFEEEYGVKVIYETFETSEEVMAKIRTGRSGYDVVVLPEAEIPIAIKNKWIVPLDHDKLPNLKYLDKKFSEEFMYDPGNKYAVPYLWGTTGIGYNTARVEENVDAWAWLFDEEFLKKYKKKITMLPEVRELFLAAQKYLGYSVNDLREEVIRECLELLKMQKPYLATYADATEYVAGLASERFWVSQAWSGDVYVVREENPNVKYVIPKEGTDIWCDCMTIPANAPNPEAAHAWINFILYPPVIAVIASWRWYATPNWMANGPTPELSLVVPAVRKDPGVYPTQGIYEKLEWLKPLTPEEKEILDRAFQELMMA